ncbi:CST complex subunit Ten1 [Xylaria grammica]|nr:CST complex subunit Ten1 [Xylaria grammica]
MSAGPLPSDRCLLSALCDKQVGDKVRFLGWAPVPCQLAVLKPEPRRHLVSSSLNQPSAWGKSPLIVPLTMLSSVTRYSSHSARLTLKHYHPKNNSDVEALVDVKLILETLKSEQTDVGQWVHVIGYLTFVNPTPLGNKTAPRAGVQALLLWVARDLDLGAYEKSMVADAKAKH